MRASKVGATLKPTSAPTPVVPARMPMPAAWAAPQVARAASTSRSRFMFSSRRLVKKSLHDGSGRRHRPRISSMPGSNPTHVDYLEGLMEGFVAYDGDWIMTYMNASAERMLGRNRADVLGKTWHQAFPHAVGNRVDHMYQRVKSGRRPER